MEALEELTAFEKETFLFCGIQEIVFQQSRTIGQTCVTTRGNDMIVIAALQKNGLLTSSDGFYKLTEKGREAFVAFVKKFFNNI